jgi:DNA-directed RNA polymerase I, II, and III subunit RPABC1
MDYETLNVLFQSRKTLLTILGNRGYNTKPYEKFGPIEIAAMAAASVGSAGTGAFRMDLVKTEKGAGITGCRVEYSLNRIKNKISGFLEALTEEGNDAAVNPATTELVIVLLEPIVEAFHVAALSIFASKGLRVNFFQAHTIVNNPTEHVLVPKHELLPAAEHPEFMQKNRIKSKTQLPLIKFHEDMIARIMGLLPGDIVKITRPSPSAGEYISYRVCVP